MKTADSCYTEWHEKESKQSKSAKEEKNELSSTELVVLQQKSRATRLNNSLDQPRGT